MQRMSAISPNDNNPPYIVTTQNIDWERAPFARNISLPSPQPHTLIKYSEARFSPVSPFAAKNIQLACPSVYRDFEPDKHSERIADELDSAFIEELDWGKKGGTTTEFLKKQLRVSHPGIEHTDTRISLTLTARSETHCTWIYCTSIDPGTNSKRQIQKNTSPLTMIL